MSCLFAFLLSSVGRLVLVGQDQNFNHYSVHDNLNRKQFPVPRENSDIIHYSTLVKPDGTYHAMYCSFQKSADEILLELTRKRPKLIYKPNTAVAPVDRNEKICLNYIETIPQELSNPLMSVLTRGNNCSTKVIAGLANKRKIQVVGTYRHFAPQLKTNVPLIEADKPVMMSDLLTKYSFYLSKNVNLRFKLLLWYQGNLHCFSEERVSEESLKFDINSPSVAPKFIEKVHWFLETNIDDLAKKRHNLINFLVHYAGCISKLQADFRYITGQFQYRSPVEHRWNLSKDLLLKTKFKQDLEACYRAVGNKLDASQPWGQFGH
ncbi:BgTH12-06941 [Blumeria graminis f. sp. triticale]|uniref:BgTH12-06941 n=1 Tax=Blumeria graminis f. sp. triticale TaxID=1689686 RepID=A0A9W4DQA5_BLUGR|nr:BgTH12-06941 [Blumeria graminis f. sp. triticale]